MSTLFVLQPGLVGGDRLGCVQQMCSVSRRLGFHQLRWHRVECCKG